MPRNPYSKKEGFKTCVGHPPTHKWQAVHLALNLSILIDPGGETAFFLRKGFVLGFVTSIFFST